MGVTGAQALYSEWALVTICLVFVLIRLYIRKYVQPNRSTLGIASDGAVVLAWIFQVAGAACDTDAYRLGLWREDLTYTSNLIQKIPDGLLLQKILKVVYASVLPYYSGLWFTKIAFLLFYYSLIPKEMKKLRHALNITSVFVGISYIVVVGVNLFWCLPVHRNWSLSETNICFAYSQVGPYLISLGCHIISDIAIYTLPFPLIPSLRRRLSRSQIIGVFSVFALGLICVGCTVVRVIAIGAGRNIATVGLWTSIETAMGIIVVCSPTMRYIVTKFCTFRGWFLCLKTKTEELSIIIGSDHSRSSRQKHLPEKKDSLIATPEKALFDSFSFGTETSLIGTNAVSNSGIGSSSQYKQTSLQQEPVSPKTRLEHRATLLSAGAMEIKTSSGSTVIHAPISVHGFDDYPNIYGVSPPDRPLSPDRSSIHHLTNAAVRVAQQRQYSRVGSLQSSIRSSNGSVLRFQ